MLVSCFKTMPFVAGLLVLAAADARGDDWLTRSVEVADGGAMEWSFPESWGKKPEVNMVEGIKTVRFGPYGPRKKPVFFVHIEAIVAVEPIGAANLLEITKLDIENYKKIAVESDIPINHVEGAQVKAHYFSVTDKESKIGEFDYLTLAIAASGRLLVKVFFFSSDGAPDFGADALQMIRSIKYVPPPEPEEDD